MKPLIRLRGLISRRLGRLCERRLSAGIGAGAERDGSGFGLGSGRLDEIDAARGRTRGRSGGQAQMGEDTHNHRRLNDCGDDLQGAAARWAAFDIDLEDPLEQACPTQACRRRLRVGAIASLFGRIVHGTGHDRSAQLGVGCEHAVEADQMPPGTGNERGEPLQEFQRRHHDVSSPVLIRALELQHDLAGAVALEPFVGNGRAGDIAAQVFEFLALIGAATHRGMQAEAVRVGA